MSAILERICASCRDLQTCLHFVDHPGHAHRGLLAQFRRGGKGCWGPKGGAMSTAANFHAYANSSYHYPFLVESWYAAQTRSRHEHLVAHHLGSRAIVHYFPTFTETHLWSDRRKKIEVPLFPGYVFVRIAPVNGCRLSVLKVPGVVRLVGSSLGGTPIPDEQIAAVRTMVERNLPWTSHPFLKEGDRVRVRGGALDGVEGLFVKRNGLETLVISVNAIQRSLCVSIQGYDLEVL